MPRKTIVVTELLSTQEMEALPFPETAKLLGGIVYAIEEIPEMDLKAFKKEWDLQLKSIKIGWKQ